MVQKKDWTMCVPLIFCVSREHNYCSVRGRPGFCAKCHTRMAQWLRWCPLGRKGSWRWFLSGRGVRGISLEFRVQEVPAWVWVCTRFPGVLRWWIDRNNSILFAVSVNSIQSQGRHKRPKHFSVVYHHFHQQRCMYAKLLAKVPPPPLYLSAKYNKRTFCFTSMGGKQFRHVLR